MGEKIICIAESSGFHRKSSVAMAYGDSILRERVRHTRILIEAHRWRLAGHLESITKNTDLADVSEA
jgi:hypothetical protein